MRAQTMPGTTNTWSPTRSRTGRRMWCAKRRSNQQPPRRRPPPRRHQRRHRLRHLPTTPLRRLRRWKARFRRAAASRQRWSARRTRPSVGCSSTGRWRACSVGARRACASGSPSIGQPTEISISSVWWEAAVVVGDRPPPDIRQISRSIASLFPSSAIGRDDKRRRGQRPPPPPPRSDKGDRGRWEAATLSKL